MLDIGRNEVAMCDCEHAIKSHIYGLEYRC